MAKQLNTWCGSYQNWRRLLDNTWMDGRNEIQVFVFPINRE